MGNDNYLKNVKGILSDVGHIRKELMELEEIIKKERECFKFLERAVDEQPNALEIWKKYAELRDKAENPGK